VSWPKHIGMHYVTRKSHRMQKHKFSVLCPDALFTETTPSPPSHEKKCINVSHPGCTGMHYVTRRYHRMQKDKFDVTCPGVLVVESVPVPPKHEK
jgi:hypothetical protein